MLNRREVLKSLFYASAVGVGTGAFSEFISRITFDKRIEKELSKSPKREEKDVRANVAKEDSIDSVTNGLLVFFATGFARLYPAWRTHKLLGRTPEELAKRVEAAFDKKTENRTKPLSDQDIEDFLNDKNLFGNIFEKLPHKRREMEFILIDRSFRIVEKHPDDKSSRYKIASFSMKNDDPGLPFPRFDKG